MPPCFLEIDSILLAGETIMSLRPGRVFTYTLRLTNIVLYITHNREFDDNITPIYLHCVFYIFLVVGINEY